MAKQEMIKQKHQTKIPIVIPLSSVDVNELGQTTFVKSWICPLVCPLPHLSSVETLGSICRDLVKASAHTLGAFLPVSGK